MWANVFGGVILVDSLCAVCLRRVHAVQVEDNFSYGQVIDNVPLHNTEIWVQVVRYKGQLMPWPHQNAIVYFSVLHNYLYLMKLWVI